jgi:acetyl-CoA carboxylase biotin carboxyl carrier protein
MTLGYDEIAEILKIIDASQCDEVVIETGDIKLVVRRHGAAAAVPQQTPMHLAQPAAPAPLAESNALPSPPPTAKLSAGAAQFQVTAPMVGTFYRAPSPDAPPFVEAGNVVRKGQPLCLIEVMKLFTTLYADRDGRVAYIGAENGAFVEFGQALFVLDPV